MKQRNLASNGEELSANQLSIGKDGKLSLVHNGHDCEVVGIIDNIFMGTILMAVQK